MDENNKFINYPDFATQIWQDTNYEYVHSHWATFYGVYSLAFEKNIDELYSEIKENIIKLIEEELIFMRAIDSSYVSYVNQRLKEKKVNKEFKKYDRIKRRVK